MAKKKKNQKSDGKVLLLLLIILGLFVYDYLSTGGKISFSILNNFMQPETKNVETAEVSTDLKIYFLDVGQADSIFITNSGYNMLIDAGNNEDGSKLVKYLQDELKVTKLDYVVGTHPHEDHIGGLDDIINNFEIGTVFLPDATTTTKTFQDVLKAIQNKGLTFTVPKIGETFDLGEAKLKVIYTGTDTSDLNNTSIVLRMDFGSTSYLFTGDATSTTEKTILNEDIDVDVLKVGHHGSAYSSTNEFLAKVTPKYAIISVAKENSYGHPSDETLERIKKQTTSIYMTSELGTILLTSDGENYNFTYLETDTNG